MISRPAVRTEWLCALALSFEAEGIPLAVVDLDRTPASRGLIESFFIPDSFAHVGHAASTAEAERWLQGGFAQVALVVPDGFARELARGETPSLQVLLDGTSSNVAAQARSHALAIVARFPVDAAPAAAAGMVLPVVRTWYDPGQRYSSFTVLSMIAVAALMVGVIYPAASIVREKEVGTIEQLRVTPIGTAELFVAKTFPTLVIGLLAVFDRSTQPHPVAGAPARLLRPVSDHVPLRHRGPGREHARGAADAVA